ncbi:MAG: hypothetical protein V1667_00770 [bacterium]
MKEFPSNPELKTEKLPFQRWHPIINLFKQAPDKIYFMTAMKKGGIDINGENITPIDFFSSCSDLSDQEIIDSIEAYLLIEKLEDKIEEINQSLESSKKYIEEYLHLRLPKEVQNLEKLKNKNDALKIFKKTSVSKDGKNIGLSPAYCAVVSVLAAAFEFEKKEMRGMIQESATLYESMFRENDSMIRNFHKIVSVKTGYDKSAIFDELNGKIFIADSYFRGKNENSFITKFINKPEATSEEISKDGLGFKFEVKSTHDAIGLISFLVRYFKEKFAADNFIFENTNLVDRDEIKEIELEVKKNLNDFLMPNDFNQHANPNFECFKINGSLSARKGGDAQGMKIRRRFEIQIVLSNNTNESGFSSHFIYEGSKKLFATTRLLGSFTERYLDLICDEASAGSGISAKKIKNYFKNNFIVEVKAKGYDKKRYANKNCAKRFMNSGIFSGDMEIKK